MDHELQEALKILSDRQYRGYPSWGAVETVVLKNGEEWNRHVKIQPEDLHYTPFEIITIANALKNGEHA
jgi:hypothetical protein